MDSGLLDAEIHRAWMIHGAWMESGRALLQLASALDQIDRVDEIEIIIEDDGVDLVVGEVHGGPQPSTPELARE